MTTPSPAPGRRVPTGRIRFLGRVVRGLLAVAVLVALVVGLPWALWHYIGWPLPDRIPTWTDVEKVLLGPVSTTFVLNVLACAIWIVWTAFTLDVLRCTVELARGGINVARLPNLSTAGPRHALAGVLISAILLSVLGNRIAPARATASPSASGAGQQTVATAPAWQHSAHTSAIDTSARPISVVVRAPHHGVHDSLSRIAERTLGDAARWPEIFTLNEGKPQPNGRTLTNPHLIFPGEELVLPGAPAPTRPAPPSQNSPVPPPISQAPIPPPPTRAAPPTTVKPTPSVTGTESQPQTTGEPGFRWGPDLFIGLGVAAAISAALLTARRRYRARYRPGSGDRDDLPVAPVVYELHLAHLRDEDELDDEDPAEAINLPRPIPPPPALVIGDPPTGPTTQGHVVAPALGVQDDQEIALDLAAARGLGLVGPGGAAAARALLMAALTTADPALPGARVVVPTEDLAALLGHDAAQETLPAALRVVADLQEALDVLEAEAAVRAADTDRKSRPPMILVARPPQHYKRLQAVLDNGAPFGITGLILGQWQPGVTCYVRDDGVISSTSPGSGEALRGTQMFRIGDDHLDTLLNVLRQAEADPPAEDDRTQTPSDTESSTPARAKDELEILGPARREPPGARPRPAEGGPVKPAETEYVPTARPTLGATPESITDCGGDVTRAQVSITMLGALEVRWHPPGQPEQEITGALQPRTQELLVLFALHPSGLTRDALVSTLWGENPPTRPTNALHTALSRLRRDFADATDGAVTDIALVNNGHYRLNPATVDVDYWRFENAVNIRRMEATDADRIAAYREVVNNYGGPLADGLSKAEWIEPAREAIRRDAIDAVSGLARALIKDDPQQTLDLLEIARAFDPHNELLYRDIMRLQDALGQADAIPRTLALLATRLAEVNDKPASETRKLATSLSQRREHDLGGSLGHAERPVARDRRQRSAS